MGRSFSWIIEVGTRVVEHVCDTCTFEQDLLFRVNISAAGSLTYSNRTLDVQALHLANFFRFLDMLS